MTYLDANASEPLRPAARQAMLAAMDFCGNPASVHAAGRAARRILEDAREYLAAAFGAEAANVVFTSGATEADALAVSGLRQGRRTMIGSTEHDAIRAAVPNAAAVRVRADGVVDLDALQGLLAQMSGAGTVLVCLMLANNETGVLHPLDSVVRMCRDHGAWLHVDAAQGPGRVPVDLTALGADSMALSSHKIGGPTGAGALLLTPRAAAALRPLIQGGGQERGRRGGTPALAAIAGFAAAAQEAVGADPGQVTVLRDAMEAAAVRAGACVMGAGAPRLGNTTCLALPGVRAGTQVMALDLAGIAVSAGAACSSGKVAESHVLRAMGAGKLAGQAIRVSVPWNATQADVDAFATAYGAMVARFCLRLPDPILKR